MVNTGKVFQESRDIQQDQAKILVDYYQAAAERIVDEEERIEKEIAVLVEEREALQKQVSGLWIWFLTIILFFMYFIKKKRLEVEIHNRNARIAEFREMYEGIFRDYRVEKLGVVYVPVAEQLPYGGKSFIVDYSGHVAESEFSVQVPKNGNQVVESIDALHRLSEDVPIVESSDHAVKVATENYSVSIQNLPQYDYFGKLDGELRLLMASMNNMDTVHVSLPLVDKNSDFRKTLKEFATFDIPEGAPVVDILETEQYRENIERFKQLHETQDALAVQNKQFEDLLKGVMVDVANSVQKVSTLKVASSNKIVMESNKLLYRMLKGSYNHYSPLLEQEEIERIRNEDFNYSEQTSNYHPFALKPSSRVRFNLISGLWEAEDKSTTNTPFGVHQIIEEIVAPTVQNLMRENRERRLELYNHIKDQKISYLNKWHQDTDAFYRANRAESADLISLMQESIRAYVAAYSKVASLDKTLNSMMVQENDAGTMKVDAEDSSAEAIATFEMQSAQFQKIQSDFEDYIDRIKEDIDRKAEQFGYVEYYDASLSDAHSRDVAVARMEVQILDERRKPLASVNPLFAKNSELPPEPKIEQLMYEHMSLNLPSMVNNLLKALDAEDIKETESAIPMPPVPNSDGPVSVGMRANSDDVSGSDVPDRNEKDRMADILASLSDEELRELSCSLELEISEPFDRKGVIGQLLKNMGENG